MGCHGDHAISHNQNGFIIEEHHVLTLSSYSLLNQLKSIRNAPRHSMKVYLPTGLLVYSMVLPSDPKIMGPKVLPYFSSFHLYSCICK